VDPYARCHWPLSINEEKNYLIRATLDRLAEVLKCLHPPEAITLGFCFKLLSFWKSLRKASLQAALELPESPPPST
jgi:hypothetical protein